MDSQQTMTCFLFLLLRNVDLESKHGVLISRAMNDTMLLRFGSCCQLYCMRDYFTLCTLSSGLLSGKLSSVTNCFVIKTSLLEKRQRGPVVALLKSVDDVVQGLIIPVLHHNEHTSSIVCRDRERLASSSSGWLSFCGEKTSQGVHDPKVHVAMGAARSDVNFGKLKEVYRLDELGYITREV